VNAFTSWVNGAGAVEGQHPGCAVGERVHVMGERCGGGRGTAPGLRGG
jgi:hypothetical protein